MQRAHKIRLVPNKTQELALRRACGVARYTWNWALAEWNRQYEAGEKPGVKELKKQWNQVKPEWVYESPKDANQQPFEFLGRAWRAYFKKTAGKPGFKKRGIHDSFYVSNDKFSVDAERIRLPVIGRVKMREALRFSGEIMSATVSCSAGRWYVSIQVDMPAEVKKPNDSVVGVDVGIKDIAIASDGTRCSNPKGLRKARQRLVRAQRAVARKQKGSANRRKAVVKLQRIHERVVNQRQDNIHKFSHAIAKNHGVAVIETLQVQDMRQNAPKYLRVLLQDTAMREVHRQLRYKVCKVDQAPAYYPSSKACCQCGHVKDTLVLSERIYKCEACGAVRDRDDNAAINLSLMRWATPCRPVELAAKPA